MKPRVFDKKAEKAHDQAMKIAAKAINGDFRLPQGEPLTPAERRELRALRARQRRASEWLQRVVI